MDKREWGIRVGPPVKRCRRGFLFLPLGFWALIGTILMFWAMGYDIAHRTDNAPRTVDERQNWF